VFSFELRLTNTTHQGFPERSCVLGKCIPLTFPLIFSARFVCFQGAGSEGSILHNRESA
jgi:hypothetical protein